MKKYLRCNTSNPQGVPLRSVIEHFRRRFEYDIDDYYGYMFDIPDSDIASERDYARLKGFTLEKDPDNDTWYYLMMVD